MQIRESGKKIIQDRTIYEDAHIFALIFTLWD
jgi:deoxyadenosine/deoxycytidine kinase